MLPIASSKPPMPAPAGAPQPPQGPPPQAGPPQGGPPMPPPGAGGPPPPGAPNPAIIALMKAKMAAGAGAGGPKVHSKYDVDKVSPETSGYMGPDKGPFECGNCVHFMAPGSCQIVAGDIEEDGCCNLFNPSGKESGEQEPGDESEPGGSASDLGEPQ
jgi:hypothetical protein